jgi:hypothetical protein
MIAVADRNFSRRHAGHFSQPSGSSRISVDARQDNLADGESSHRFLDYRDDFLVALTDAEDFLDLAPLTGAEAFLAPAAFAGAETFLAEGTFTLPMTAIDPEAGTIVDSSPVDHLT